MVVTLLFVARGISLVESGLLKSFILINELNTTKKVYENFRNNVFLKFEI